MRGILRAKFSLSIPLKFLSQLRITVINSEKSYYSYLVFGHLLHLTLIPITLSHIHTHHTLNRMPMMTFLDKYLRIYTRNTYFTHTHKHTHDAASNFCECEEENRRAAASYQSNKKKIIGKYFYKKLLNCHFS